MRGEEWEAEERRRALEHIHRLTLTEEMENRAELNVCAERKDTTAALGSTMDKYTPLMRKSNIYPSFLPSFLPYC